MDTPDVQTHEQVELESKESSKEEQPSELATNDATGSLPSDETESTSSSSSTVVDANISSITKLTSDLSLEHDKLKPDKDQNTDWVQVLNILEKSEDAKLEVINRNLSLAISHKDDKYVSPLLQDSSIRNILIWYMKDESEKILRAVLDVFEVLTSNKVNHESLKHLPYFMARLKEIRRTSTLSDDTRADAHKIYEMLSDSKHPLSERSMSMRNSENELPKEEKPRKTKTATLTRNKKPSREAIFVLRSGVLQQAFNRDNIQKHLIKVKGIVSLTYNLAKNHCIVRGHRDVAPEKFGTAIANLGYQVSWIRKSACGEEVIPIPADLTDVSAKENMPQYLPEDFVDPEVPYNAVSKQKSAAENEPSSVFKSALTFVRNSFYW